MKLLQIMMTMLALTTFSQEVRADSCSVPSQIVRATAQRFANRVAEMVQGPADQQFNAMCGTMRELFNVRGIDAFMASKGASSGTPLDLGFAVAIMLEKANQFTNLRRRALAGEQLSYNEKRASCGPNGTTRITIVLSTASDARPSDLFINNRTGIIENITGEGMSNTLIGAGMGDILANIPRNDMGPARIGQEIGNRVGSRNAAGCPGN